MYTRIVIFWRRVIGLMVLAIVIGLPVSGTICAMLCQSGPAAKIQSTAPELSEPIAECHRRSSSVPSAIRNNAHHECGGHETAAQLTTTIAVSRVNPSSSGIPAVEAACRLFDASAISERPTVLNVLSIVKAPPASAHVLRI